ncbi:hypothetical protein CFOL_v3_17777 [Cephalotus follicularis]|uniref:Retrovirus-related Pol polyprotein from transposon TNT 1-94-like beta-barrel domain-containing protein n=1 Tax=Cephalotus follicularis TaxID=3775 RepID=A0A1Q3C210_CEPFO|nr:hypothetical protein CFOL_v3_17777 [Cephalotus follicularis]
MCAINEQFSTYQVCDGDTINMTNNTECNVTGIRLVQICMFDGAVKTLADVRHVPNLRKNLISLGTLDLRWCKITIEGGVMRVTKGALVKLQGMMIGKLYKLVGTVQTGGGSVRSQASATVEGGGYEMVPPEVGCTSKEKQVTFASL